MIKVGVIGANGRMGTEVCRAVAADPDLDLGPRLGSADPIDALSEGGTDVAVEFTTPSSVRSNVERCLDMGIHVVVGATGLSRSDLQDIEERAKSSGRNVFVAPNFAVGAVLMMQFAQRAAAFFDRAEIVERHHDKKLDAPSGTALRTAELMAASLRDADSREDGGASPLSRGEAVGDVRIHSLRLPGSVAHQEVVLGSPGETLTIRHDSLDRSSFMPGVLLAIKRVQELPGLTVGLERLLEP